MSENKGWGFAPKLVFANPDISPTAKALFGLLSSYQESDSDYLPSQEALAYQLGIKIDTLAKYIKELQQFPWFEIEKIPRTDGKFEKNKYIIKTDIIKKLSKNIGII